MKQAALIRDYLEHHPEGLTQLEALEKFGCGRLAPRILEIKKGKGVDPMEIDTIHEKTNGKTYARYKKAQTKPLFGQQFCGIHKRPFPFGANCMECVS